MKYKYKVDYEDEVGRKLDFKITSQFKHGTPEFKKDVSDHIYNLGIEPIGNFGSLLLKTDKEREG